MDLLQALDRTRDETLRHFELGLLGDIDEDKVSFYRATTRRHTLSPTVASSPMPGWTPWEWSLPTISIPRKPASSSCSRSPEPPT
jgi:hypothetical protein